VIHLEKVVQVQGSYEMVSWPQGDVVNYGIRKTSEIVFLQTYKPTPDLKGWDLRKHVQLELEAIASSVVIPEEITLPEDYIPEGLKKKCPRTMKVPIVCWNPPKKMSSRCDICAYSWMCRIPLKSYPKK
jgi:hypothetical protein